MASLTQKSICKTSMRSKVHPDRPMLAPGMALEALDRYYWYMAELVAYCRVAGKELGGWETIEMVQKYAHLSPSHIAAHANTVKFWTPQRPKKIAQPNGVALSA